MIVLIIMMVDIGRVDHWLPGVYNTVVVSYLVTSLVWLAVTFRDPTPRGLVGRRRSSMCWPW